MAFPEAAGAFETFKAGGTSGTELLAFLRHELPEWIGQLDPNVGTRMEAAAQISAADFLERKMNIDALASAARKALRRRGRGCMADRRNHAPQSFPGYATGSGYRPLNLKSARNTCVANFLKLNALTPAGGVDAQRMPVGLQVMADHGRDDFLFAAGLAIEKVLGTALLPPGDTPNNLRFRPGPAPRYVSARGPAQREWQPAASRPRASTSPACGARLRASSPSATRIPHPWHMVTSFEGGASLSYACTATGMEARMQREVRMNCATTAAPSPMPRRPASTEPARTSADREDPSRFVSSASSCKPVRTKRRGRSPRRSPRAS
jgi:hypothetical protein